MRLPVRRKLNLAVVIFYHSETSGGRIDKDFAAM